MELLIKFPLFACFAENGLVNVLLVSRGMPDAVNQDIMYSNVFLNDVNYKAAGRGFECCRQDGCDKS